MSGFSKIVREVFSGANGKLSSKRTIGGVAMAVALSSTVYLVVVDRGTEVVENLLTTILILSASLLGLPAITGVFGKSKITSMEPSNTQEESQPLSNPCDECPYNKKGTD